MVKRRTPIRTIITGNHITPSFMRRDLISSVDIINRFQQEAKQYEEDAYTRYNASQYNVPKYNSLVGNTSSVVEPIVYNNNKVSYSKQNKHYKYDGNQDDFINTIYDSYYRAVRPNSNSDEDAIKQATFLAQKAAFETGYGKHIANTHNYGGHKTKSGWVAFNSMDDFTKKDVALLDRKWPSWRNAKNDSEFIDAINTNNGGGMYAPPSENVNYKGRYMSLSNRINDTLSRRKQRPKAWIGAAIGAASSILGSIFSSNAQEELMREQMEEQRRLREHENALKSAANLTEAFNSQAAAQKEYENRFRTIYKKGGRRKLRDGVSITDGGYAIPIDYNTFLLRGGSHEDVNESGNTGIGLVIGSKPSNTKQVLAKGGKVKGKEIEAEGGEIIQKTPNEVRIFSDSLILPNGETPAESVLDGYNKDYIFAMQQNMNGNYGVNKRKLRNGGKVSRPVERIKADIGLLATLKNAYNWTAEQWRKFEEATTLESVKQNIRFKPDYTISITPPQDATTRTPLDYFNSVDEAKRAISGVNYDNAGNLINSSGNYVPTITTKTEDVIGGATNKFGANFKTADWIQLGADLFGGLYSAISQGNAANYIEDPAKPVLKMPAKMITNYNANPELAVINDAAYKSLRDSDERITSAGRIDLRNAINRQRSLALNNIYGKKTNTEIGLLNQDALNQQTIHSSNVDAINQYYKDLADARMRRGLMRSQARIAGISGIGDAVGNILDQGKQRYSDQQAMNYYMALLPEEGRTWLRRNRVDFLRKGGRIR